jgi:hypothetical protein
VCNYYIHWSQQLSVRHESEITFHQFYGFGKKIGYTGYGKKIGDPVGGTARKIDPMTSRAIPWLFPSGSKGRFVQGFHTKHVSDVQKLAEVGDLFLVMGSLLCTVH